MYRKECNHKFIVKNASTAFESYDPIFGNGNWKSYDSIKDKSNIFWRFY